MAGHVSLSRTSPVRRVAGSDGKDVFHLNMAQNFIRFTGSKQERSGSMAVLHFDKNELGNLEYSLQREMLSTNT